MRRWYRAPFLLALLALVATPILAQTSDKTSGARSSSGMSGIAYRGWGVQVGASSNHDQVYGGVHWDLGEFAKDVRFRPNVEIGFGDHETLLQGTAEVTYILSKIQVWKPFVGGEIGLAYVDIDRSILPAGEDNTHTALALMGVGGIETRLKSGNRFELMVKVGFGDRVPDVKFAAGWTWK